MNACEKFHGTVTSKNASASPLRAASIQLRMTKRSSGPTSLTVSARTSARTRVGWRRAKTCDTSRRTRCRPRAPARRQARRAGRPGRRRAAPCCTARPGGRRRPGRGSRRAAGGNGATGREPGAPSSSRRSSGRRCSARARARPGARAARGRGRCHEPTCVARADCSSPGWRSRPLRQSPARRLLRRPSDRATSRRWGRRVAPAGRGGPRRSRPRRTGHGAPRG